MSLQTIQPATGDLLREYPVMEMPAVRRVISLAHKTQQQWRHSPLDERASCLRQVARHLRENAPAYAELMAEEMGKPVREGRAEAEKCAWVCEYYADHGPAYLAREQVDLGTDASRAYVTFEPLGVILAIMPWNFPFWQVFRFAAPALMAGNGVLLKHASNVTGCAMSIASLLRHAGFPRHLFEELPIETRQVRQVLRHRHVAAVTLTGSTRAGQAVAQEAGKHLKKAVLELGGSDPYVILEDADLDRAADLCVKSRLINSGQSCIAAKRFIVVDSVREAFEARLVAGMREARVGDPMEETTLVGPMARVDLRDALHEQVQASISRGARCLLGGTKPPGPGAYYPPTVLTEVRKGMPAYDEELFGPVAAVLPARHEREAIRLANDSEFGLGAAVFTRDLTRGEQLAARELEAGSCFVNDFVKSDPRLPFGGIKASGYGRELSHFGMREFVNIKTVVIAS